MVRTQIYFPKSELDALKKISRKLNTTLSEVVRSAMRKHVIEKEFPSKPKPYKTFMESLEEVKKLGLKTRGEKDLSKKVDYYLYGRKD